MRLERRLGYETRVDSTLSELLWSGLVSMLNCYISAFKPTIGSNLLSPWFKAFCSKFILKDAVLVRYPVGEGQCMESMPTKVMIC